MSSSTLAMMGLVVSAQAKSPLSGNSALSDAEAAMLTVQDKMFENDLKMHHAEVAMQNQTHDLGDLMESVNLLMDSLKPEEHGGSPLADEDKAEHKQKIKDELTKRRTRKRMPSTLTRLEELIPRIDADSDGRLSFDEMLGYTRAQRDITYSPAMAAPWDKNSDGFLSKLEMLEGKLGLGKSHQIKTDKARSILDKQRALETKKFDAADKNKDGILDPEELKAFMHPPLDEEVMTTELKNLISFRDEKPDGQIELWEFLSPAPRIMDIQYDIHNKEREMFAIHDKDDNKVLDWDELKDYSYGETKLLHELKSLIEALDKDRDGQISKDEFLSETNDKQTNRTIQLNHAVDEWAFHDHEHKTARGEEL